MEPMQIQLKSLNQVTRELVQCRTIEELINKSLNAVFKNLNPQVASIFLFNKNGFIQRVGIEGIDEKGKPIDNTWFPEEKYQPGESFSGKPVPPVDADSGYGEPNYSNDLASYPGMINREKYEEKIGKLKCGISIPLNGLNRTFGTLEVFNKQDGNSFTDHDFYWLMLIGTSIADVISFLRSADYNKIHTYLIEQLISLKPTTKKFDLKGAYQEIARLVISDFTPYKVCIIRVPSEDENLDIESQECTNDISLQGRKDSSIPIKSHIVGKVYNTREPCFLENINLEIDNFFNKDWIQSQKLKSFACLPLVIQDECFGTISIYTSYQRKFYPNDDKFLNNVAYLTAAITARVSILEKYRKVQRDLTDAREKLLNASMLVSYDSLLRGFLHQYKNELIELRQTLDTLAGETNQKKRDTIIKSKDFWLEQRIQEIQASFRKSNPVPVEINQLIQDAANLFLEHTNIEIEEKYDQTIPIITIEKEKIESVIYNLISNAVIAINKSKKRDGKIIIETNIINIDGMQHIQIIIEDNGIGIPNKNAEKIFQEGFTTRKQEGGTGMGLYISRIIINDYGGKIVFSSRIGKGTKFFVRIPLELYQI